MLVALENKFWFFWIFVCGEGNNGVVNLMNYWLSYLQFSVHFVKLEMGFWVRLQWAQKSTRFVVVDSQLELHLLKVGILLVVASGLLKNIRSEK